MTTKKPRAGSARAVSHEETRRRAKILSAVFASIGDREETTKAGDKLIAAAWKAYRAHSRVQKASNGGPRPTLKMKLRAFVMNAEVIWQLDEASRETRLAQMQRRAAKQPKLKMRCDAYVAALRAYEDKRTGSVKGRDASKYVLLTDWLLACGYEHATSQGVRKAFFDVTGDFRRSNPE